VQLALRREHEREGQSFFLHNRVETIEEAAEHLRQLCPELRYIVAHGRCPSASSSSTCSPFLAGDADVLVSTTIIESGLDIPQANTLIVERAGCPRPRPALPDPRRVGRSDVTAHAYLFYPTARS
jgi:transcription-repair coupling factor (superfamily II helicase)